VRPSLNLIPPGRLGRLVITICALTLLVSCDTVSHRTDTSEPPRVYAYPDSGRPSFSIFDTDGGGVRTGIQTFTGETIIYQWSFADSSAASPYGIAKSCALKTKDGLEAQNQPEEGAVPKKAKFDVVTPFLHCMKSQGLKGRQTDIVLPSYFMFGVEHEGLAARYQAKKDGTAFSQFKTDVDACAVKLRTDRQIIVQRFNITRAPVLSGGSIVESAPTYTTISPAGSALRGCMEEFGYMVEDRPSLSLERARH
jgi:hypothetical protein